MCKLLSFIREKKKGASIIIVIMLMTLLMVLTMGLAAVTSFGVNSSVMQRNYTQAYYAAKSINMSICNAITSQAGLSMINGWEQEFEEALNNESYYVKNLEGEITEINIPDEKLTYSNGSGYKHKNLENTGIDVKNIITLKYEREDELNYRVKELTVETAAAYNDRDYTIKAKLKNEGYKGGGGGTGGSGGGGKYVVGSTVSSNIHNATYIGGISSNENINMQGIKVTEGVYSIKDITIQYDNANISGGVYSNSNIVLNGITSEGDIIAGNNITIGSSAGKYKGNIIAEDINIQGQGSIEGTILAKNKALIGNSATDVPITGNIVSLGAGGIETYKIKLTGNIIAGKGPVKLNNGGVVMGDIISKKNVSLTNVTVNGNVISDESITFPNGGTVEGDIIAKGDVSLTGVTVNGKIISNGNVILRNCNVQGNIYSNTHVEITGGTTADIYSIGSPNRENSFNNIFDNGVNVNGNIETNGSVNFKNGGSVYNIYSGINVDLTNVDVQGDIHAVGYVNMPNGKTVNEILSNDTVNLTGVTAKNIKANGSITTGWSVVITGKAMSNSTITSKTTYIKEENVSEQFASLQRNIDIDEHLNLIESIGDNLEDALNSVLTPEIRSGINSTGKVEPTPSALWKYEPEPAGDMIKRTLPASKVFDASEGDLFYEISGNMVIDDSYSIVGNNNVYIKMTGNSGQKTTFLTTREDLKMAKQLYIISDDRHTVDIYKNDAENNWQNQYATVINAQIYMPHGQFILNNSKVITFNGILTIANAENGSWNNSVFNRISGNYKNTSLEEYLGGSSGGSTSTVIEKGEWSVERFYR